MPNWSQIIESYQARAHANDGFRLMTFSPASQEVLDHLQDELGLELPAEFRSLYSEFDGIGVVHESEPEIIWWLFRPTDEIASFCDEIRARFEGTHEGYATRFFPFIDLANGDGIGYVTEESGLAMNGLFLFEHESYKHAESQDVNEFLSHLPMSIEEFLGQRK